MAAGAPHTNGHRARLRQRFLDGMGTGMADHELLELVLAMAIPRRDVKPLAKALLARFKSLRGVLMASAADLKQEDGVGDSVVVTLKLVLGLSRRIAAQDLRASPVLADRVSLMDYLYTRYADCEREEMVVLFLDAKMQLLADETLFTGTLDSSVAAPRDIIKRALAHNAAGLLVAHNHPSGVPAPSAQDRAFTRQLADLCAGLDMALHDHVIVGRDQHFSFKGAGEI